MMNKFYWFSCLPIFLHIILCSAVGNIDQVQLNALHDLYQSTNGDHWSWDTSFDAGPVWNFSIPEPNPCFPTWQGLSCLCSGSACDIATINLGEYNLTGPIPASIGNLTKLTTLSMPTNSLNGSIPESIGKLTMLEIWDLHSNALSNSIPSSIGFLTNISYLDLAINILSGSMPEEIWSLKNLSVLRLYENRLSGSVPSSIGLLESITELDISDNALIGTLPSTIGNLTTMVGFFVTYNELHGSIPVSICKLKNLKYLYGPGNEFSGNIPDCIGEMSSLQNLAFFENNLEGSLPASFINLIPNLHAIEFSANYLSGSIPLNLFNSTQSNLIRIYLDNNLFTGSLPILSIPALLAVEFSSNHISGIVAASVCQSSRLLFLSAANNRIEGTIPTCIGELEYLSALVLSNNQLSGTIPHLTQELVPLTQFQIDDNQLTGALTSSICTNLPSYLDVGGNFLSGTIPDCENATGSLIYYSVSDNVLSGSIPLFLQNEWNANTITIDTNVLTGTLPYFNSSSVLVYLYAQGNKLDGKISLNSMYSSLEYVDLSNNQLTGTLPVEFFNSTIPLVSFIVSSNCITGTIPDEICSLSSLVFLNLNGLSTATTCRSPIFPHLDGIKSFTLPHQIEGTIPSCLFNMPRLQSLEVSGNSIEWSFPTELTIGENLSSMSLSHNKITGTIPSVIQHRQWSLLDLSFNKLVGTLHFDEQDNANASLVLQINRLSGGIPSTLVNLESINILNGNLFGCDFERSSLPVHDQSHKTYQCGSNSFDIASIAWIVNAAIATVLLLVSLLFVRKWWTAAASFYQEAMACLRGRTSKSSLVHFYDSMIVLRNSAVAATLLIVVVFLPVYGALTYFFNTVQYQYAWSVSAAFLSGVSPAVVLFTLYLLLIIGLCFARIHWNNGNFVMNSVKHEEVQSKPSYRWLALFLTVTLNCIVVVAANASYVAVILKENTFIVLLAQFALVLFKLFWNDFAVTGLVEFSRKDGNSDSIEHASTELPFMTSIILFNSILAPCLATFVVDSNCFLNVFVASQSVSSQFPYFSVKGFCRYVEADVSGQLACYVKAPQTSIEVSYDPPFIYSYQCSSSMLTNFASVYVFMYMTVAFLKPLALWATHYWYATAPKGSCLHIALKSTMYNLLKPANAQHLETKKVLFHKDKLILRLVAKVAVLLTFGVIFPLVAVVACVAFVVEIYITMVVVGRFLASIPKEEERDQFRVLLKRDTQGCVELLALPVMKLVVPFASYFYAFFVFDIYGDKVGLRKAVWAPVVLVLTPVIIWFAYASFDVWQKAQNNKERLRNDVDIELPTVNVLQKDVL